MFKFKIGTKLGISAGLGVLLVAAMVINQQMSGDSIAVANKSMRIEAEIAKKVVECRLYGDRSQDRNFSRGNRDWKARRQRERERCAPKQICHVTPLLDLTIAT